MVYLLKWLISLITPHTHDKEGKQGNSFIVRKALGNRASFSSLASKKGSSLLLVVMTMSVIIVISSSFMLLSFNTGIGSIFASSQHKAQLSCLSVAEGLKDGNTFGSIVNQYSGELSGNQTVEFDVNDSSLDGKTTVKLEPTTSGGSVKSVKVTVTTHVGSSKYEVKFTHTMKTDSVRDVINQVTNSMSVSGGGSYSLQTGKVEGDLSLDGDYLLAMTTYKENGKKWTVCPGEIDGNVYCNGSLILGYKGEGRGIYQNGSKDRINATAIPTIIKENLYVNGDLIINACEIEGDVYVSGNVLVNGLTTTVRGNTDGKSTSNTDNAIIKGNLYVGGSLYVPTGSFSRYFPTVEKISTDSGANTETGGFALSGSFPSFPSAAQIYGNQSASDYSNALLSLYNNTISSSSTNSNGEYVFTYNNGKQETLSKDFLNSGVSFSGKVWTPYKDNRVFDGKSDKSYAQFEQLGGKLGIVCYAYSAMRVKQDGNWGEKCFEEDTDWYARAYNVLFQLLTSYHWNDGANSEGELSQESSTARDESATLRNSVSKEYEKYKLTASYGNLNNGSANISEQTFTVSKNVYVQGNAFVQFSNKKLGKETYILGELTAYSVESICTSDGGVVNGVTTAFNKLYVGSVVNYTFYTKAIIGSMENYYTANMALKATDQETSSLVQHVLKKNGIGWQQEVCSNHKKVFSKGKNYAFYYGSGTFFSSGNYENHSANQLNYSSYSTTFKLTGKETAYGSNQQLYMLFKASNLGGTGYGSGTEGYSVVIGIMSYGSNATWGKINYSVNGQTGSTARATFDALRLNEDEMYSDEFLKNHNSSAALRTEQKRAEKVETVADVLKEMGVWGYSTGEIHNKNYQNAYQGGDDTNPQKYFYNNLTKTGSDKEYKVGDNKLNDRSGVNFTGVTSATQIKFGYTLQRAINASKSGVMTVTSKGSIAHPEWTSGSATGADKWDIRILYKSAYAYPNNKGGIGPQNIETLTNYWIYGSGNVGNTFYGRLLFLGCYDYYTGVAFTRSNNYSQTERWDSESDRWTAFNRDVKEVMSYLYNPSLAGADSAMWEKYGKEYVGVIAYSPDDQLHVYLMRDIYLGGDSYYGFGDKDTDDNQNGFQLHLDTSYRSINVYWGSDANGMLNYASNSTIEISLLFPQQGSFNVAYMYLLPNIAWSNNQGTGYTVMNYQQKIDNIQDIVNAVQVQGAKVDGQNVFKGKSGKYYRYSVKYYREIDTANKYDVLNDSKFTYVCRMWNDCKVKNTAIRNNGNLVAAGIPFVMCEGPMLFMMGLNGEMSGIIYSPNPDSVFFCASKLAVGTAASDPSTTFDGGAIVTGRVIGTAGNNGRWKFFEDSDKYDVGDLLTKALIEDPNGIGDIDTSGGTNTSGNWSAGGYE